MFGLNATCMSFMHDQYRFIPAAALAGLGADLLAQRLKPSMERSGALRLFAFSLPVLYYLLYYATLLLTQGIEWTVHLWTGSIVLSGMAGLLLSFLLIPPVQSAPPLSARSHPRRRDRQALRS
jgi:hypothetical protein